MKKSVYIYYQNLLEKFFIFINKMPQLDFTLYSSIITSVIFSWFLCYGFGLVFFFYPFITAIKIKYRYMSKVIQILSIIK